MTDSERSESRCTCSGELDADGKRIVTVACPVHHLMADGTPAGEVEITCMCGNFADMRECAIYRDTDEDCDCGAHDDYVCPPCQDWASRQPNLALVTGQKEAPDA